VPPLVLLDLDGTLTDSAPGIVASARDAYAHLGLPVPDDAALRSFVGPPIGESFAGHGVPDEQVAEAIDAYRRSYRADGMFDNAVFPGIPAALVALREAGCTLAVATAKPEGFARPICDRFGLTPLVDGVFGAGSDRVRSTKAEVIAYALSELGPARVPPRAHALMVGDRAHDVLGAREHGLRTLAVGWGYAPPGELAVARPEAIVGRVDDLTAAVLSLVRPRTCG
jgi:phosphoglycolate phosphatase